MFHKIRANICICATQIYPIAPIQTNEYDLNKYFTQRNKEGKGCNANAVGFCAAGWETRQRHRMEGDYIPAAAEVVGTFRLSLLLHE